MKKIGVVCGRFHPLHTGHMDYILNAMTECEHLIVGITNPDPSLSNSDPASQHRALEITNPFTYYERYLMIRDALLNAGILREQYDIVPFPINYPNRLRYYVPLNACFFIDVFDEWGYRKIELLRSQGIEDIRIRFFDKSKKTSSGTEIRALFIEDGDWEHLVPTPVCKIIREIGVENLKNRMLIRD